MAKRSDWCIVALPEETNPVYKVSSEKVPHLTLLFLGEQSEPALAIRMIETIQHTIKTSFQSKFSLGVERRGTLGKDQADVLFFYKDEAGRVGDFRSLLLKNDDIKTAYDSTEQFPEWTPHLTLGYPDRPAKPIPDDNHSISWITFDRIALWLEDSDGPEVRLGNYDSTLATLDDVYHTDQMIQRGRIAMGETEDFLTHYGVKGMKWGVRRSQAQLDRAAGRTTSGKESRKEYRARVKQERNEFYNKKMSVIVDKARKDGDNVMIKTLYAGELAQTVTTGSDFVKQLSKGRAFDVTVTEVFATKTAEGPYQMTGDRNVYQKSKRRK